MKGMTVTISVSDTKMFNEVLSLIGEVYERADDDVRQLIADRLAEALSKSFDVEKILAP